MSFGLQEIWTVAPIAPWTFCAVRDAGALFVGAQSLGQLCRTGTHGNNQLQDRRTWSKRIRTKAGVPGLLPAWLEVACKPMSWPLYYNLYLPSWICLDVHWVRVRMPISHASGYLVSRRANANDEQLQEMLCCPGAFDRSSAG